MNYPLRHISIRVPWHDTGWDGRVCAAPLLNGACLKLGLEPQRCDCLSTNFCDSGEFSTTIHPHSAGDSSTIHPHTQVVKASSKEQVGRNDEPVNKINQNKILEQEPFQGNEELRLSKKIR